MSMLNTPTKRFRLLSWTIRIGVTAILLGALWPQMPNIVRYAGQVGFHPHGPDMALFATIPPQVKFHIAAAVSAFVIGLVILLQPKGSPLHKTLGWAWVIAMGATAISSFFITGLNGNSLSIIHLISGWTVVALPLGIYAIRNKQVLMHKRAMTSLFVGGLVIAGLFTFIPGRVMYQLFFG